MTSPFLFGPQLPDSTGRLGQCNLEPSTSVHLCQRESRKYNSNSLSDVREQELHLKSRQSQYNEPLLLQPLQSSRQNSHRFPPSAGQPHLSYVYHNSDNRYNSLSPIQPADKQQM